MYKVEYLLLVDHEKYSCNTAIALMHLLQSDPSIAIDSQKNTVTFHNDTTFGFSVIHGALGEDEPGRNSTYFDLTFTCKNIKDLPKFNNFLRTIRKTIGSIFQPPSALQVIWDDTSNYYASKAYPLISSTENRMRKLITKFMHVNVGLTWIADRIPDDVQSTVNQKNTDSTYLYNVDFIKLKDILLSESFSKHRDALIKELKTSTKSNFKRDEILSLIPTSNWERYFSTQVNCDSTELDKLWTRLYDIRCKVAHNKTFTPEDLKECKKLSEKLDQILDEAISKLDDVHIEEEEIQNIAEDVALNATKEGGTLVKDFLGEVRTLQSVVFGLTSVLHTEKPKRRKWDDDVDLLYRTGYINENQKVILRKIQSIRHELIHNIDSKNIVNDWESVITTVRNMTTLLLRKSDKPGS